MMTLVVAAAIIRHGKVLAACRSAPAELRGRWEFPGGKVEPGESAEQALRRECVEELGTTVDVEERIGLPVALSGATTGGLQLYRCSLTGRAPRAGIDHSELRWLSRESLLTVDWLITNRQLLSEVAGLLDTAA